jgi:hypothetical protein
LLHSHDEWSKRAFFLTRIKSTDASRNIIAFRTSTPAAEPAGQAVGDGNF